MFGLFNKKKEYPNVSTIKSLDDMRDGMIEVMEDIYSQEKRKPTRSEIRQRFDANYYAIAVIREEWWATIEPTAPVSEAVVVDDAPIIDDTPVAESNTSTIASIDDAEQSVEDLIQEAYEKGLKEGKARSKKRVRVPNLTQ